MSSGGKDVRAEKVEGELLRSAFINAHRCLREALAAYSKGQMEDYHLWVRSAARHVEFVRQDMADIGGICPGAPIPKNHLFL